MPKRIANITFLSCVAIDILYYMSAYIQSTYYSSYVYVVRASLWKLWARCGRLAKLLGANGFRRGF